MTGGKGIQRIERPRPPGGPVYGGWQVRVPWKGRRRTKWFSDSIYGGKERARRAAVEWRNRVEAQIHKPRTERPIYPWPRKTYSNTGARGVYESVKEGKPVFLVFWAPRPGKRSETSVSIEKWGRDKAFRRAVAIRRKKMAERRRLDAAA